MKHLILIVLSLTLISCSPDEPTTEHKDYQDTWFYAHSDLGISGEFTVFNDQLDATIFTIDHTQHEVANSFVVMDGEKLSYIYIDALNSEYGLQFDVISGNQDKLKCLLTYNIQQNYAQTIIYLTR